MRISFFFTIFAPKFINPMRENQQIEFKQTLRDEYLQYLCGFANAQGGTLYIGIDDNGTICGIANARKLLENLPNQINQTMGLLAQVDLLTQDGFSKQALSSIGEEDLTRCKLLLKHATSHSRK